MVSAKAILYNNKNTGELLAYEPTEHPIVVQLFGSDPEIMADMAARVEQLGFDAIDVNMGCPVPKVVNNGEGSALLNDPVLAGRIIEAMVKKVKCTVTVKIRKGFNDESVNAVECALAAEAGGASAVAVHGRTREQYYSGKADWDIIRQVKEAVKIPVIGNGDVVDGESAKRMFDETGCDGVMVARAAQGNPFIFREIISFFEKGESCDRPTNREIYDTVIRHADMQLKYKGEYIGIREMRKHVSWYTTGMPGSAKFRGEINQMTDMASLKAACGRVMLQNAIVDTENK
jgi:nifR3 family TIM-barrel protein